MEKLISASKRDTPQKSQNAVADMLKLLTGGTKANLSPE